jgi:hypothetical protein
VPTQVAPSSTETAGIQAIIIPISPISVFYSKCTQIDTWI